MGNIKLDNFILFKVNGLVGKNQFLDFFGVLVGKWLVYLLIVFLIILSLGMYRFDDGVKIIFSFVFFWLVSWGISLIIGLIVRRKRPFVQYGSKIKTLFKPLFETWKSFPSDHAMTVAVLSFVSVIFFPWYITMIFVLGLLVVMWGRIFVGVHYPSDVLVGLLVGFLVPLLVLYLLNTFYFFSTNGYRAVLGY